MRTIIALAAVLAIGGCTLDDGAAPALTGPSEFGLSVTLSATPDQLPRDGSSQSVIRITVRDASSRPVAGQRLSVSSSGGTLSETDVVTNSSGQASSTFTAPPVGTVGNAAVIFVTPVGSDARNDAPRTLVIAFTGPSNTGAPTFATPPFTVIPDPPEVGAAARFDASGTVDSTGRPTAGVFDEGRPCMDACSYNWDFGDGSSGFGRIASHTYSVGRVYTVTLVVTDAAGSVASAARTISVNSVAPPAVTLEVAPDPPFVNQQAVFTARATPASGHSIQRYEWDFGDGTTQVTTTPTVTKIYATVGIYVATVAAFDDLGQAGRAAKSVSVGHTIAAPVANFTVSPSSPSVGANVTFNGSISTVGAGATILSYLWDKGDGSAPQDSGAVPTIVVQYGSAGTFVATLTITDSLGRQSTKTVSVTVVP
ncbi:MAG: PKD domain-containing protein [Vicinamibacterales bacterium]